MARDRSDRPPKPRSDLYVGLLVIAFLAQIMGVTFLAIDWYSYPTAKAPAVNFNRPAPAAPQAPQ
jgi:hypothetical protein